MKKLGRYGTRFHASGMIDWHNAGARWHAEWGTGSEPRVNIMAWVEEVVGIPAPCVDGRIIQALKKKPRSKARAR